MFFTFLKLYKWYLIAQSVIIEHRPLFSYCAIRLDHTFFAGLGGGSEGNQQVNLGNQAPIEIGGSQAPVEMGTIGAGGNPFGSMLFETRFYDV